MVKSLLSELNMEIHRDTITEHIPFKALDKGLITWHDSTKQQYADNKMNKNGKFRTGGLFLIWSLCTNGSILKKMYSET